jgi:hypothetical protein
MQFKQAICLTYVLVIGLFGCAAQEATTTNQRAPEQEHESEVRSSVPQAGDSNVASPATTMATQEKMDSAATTLNQPTEPNSASPADALSLLSTPLVNTNDYWGVQPFNVQGNQLGIQFHNGFDYFTDYEEVAVQAVSSGRVMFIEIFERPPDGAFQINLGWQAPSGEVISYSLEPSAGPADATKIAEQKVLAQKMMASMTVQPGDEVAQGQFLGYLYGQDEWAHVHMHMTLKANNQGPEEWLCPADFMSKMEKSDLLTKSLVWADRLYKGSKETQLCNY